MNAAFKHEKDWEFADRLQRALQMRSKKRLSPNGVVQAAVLVPLFRQDEHVKVLLTKRSELVEHHKGEISFPGGKLDDSDPDFLSCALRETWEEIGVSPQDVSILGELDDFYTVATGFLVVPFVGFIPYPYRFQASPREIDELLGVPLEVFLDPGRREESTIVLDSRPVPIISYHWEGHTIWGATARILQHFSEIISNIRRQR
jgi:8-oxo-dGTP pyrophosphatase MutT (NUDIX family)|uniref:CoA pyrophosphatase n=1 Tax=Desulfomonile tiedjei TaxID=2358 RepID=A0A7C4AR18_9BACT